MLRKSIVLLAIALLVSATALTAQTRTSKPNDISMELGGKCLLYSLNYHRALGSNFGLTVGASYIGATGEETVGVFFLSGGLRVYLLKKDTSPYLEGGLVWASAATTAGPGTTTASTTWGYVSPGFEFRSVGGF